MADQLVTKKIQRDTVVVPTSQLATQLGHVKLQRFIEIEGRDGQVKNVAAFSHRSSISVEKAGLEREKRLTAQSHSNRLERNNVRDRDVAQVGVGPHALDEVSLQFRRGSFEKKFVVVNLRRQYLLDESVAKLSV